MADEAEQASVAVQAIQFAGGTEIGAPNDSADQSDSDDYDPSASIHEESPIKSVVSQEQSPAAFHDDILSPSISTLHPLPPRPQALPPAEGASQDPSLVTQNIASAVIRQDQPRMRGGFEMDDDAEDEQEEDNKDTMDVYDSVDVAGAEPAPPAPLQHELIDSTSKTPVHPNGLARVPAHTNAVLAGASGSIPSPAPTNTALSPLRASTATPIQAVNEAQVQAVPTSLRVNTSKVPNTYLASVIPKARLAHDVVGILEDRITDDPRGDSQAWMELIDELKRRNKLDEVRHLYDRFFQVFPIAAEQWCDYVKWEEEGDRKFEMEKLFQRSLLEVPDVQLWSIYINYIRRRHSMQTGDIPKAYKIIYDSFTFALTNVGMDKDSGKLWHDYIDFIKTGPGVIGGTGWQDTQKMDSLRAAYQKAIAMPTSALNALWKEYDTFEMGLSKINGRKFLQERSPAYVTARSGFTQLQNITKDLIRTSRPKLPPAMGFEGDVEYLHQVDLWKQWIQWEKDDNLVLKDEDATAYRNRILFTYRQSLMALQFWPEMWYQAAEFCFSNGLESDGMKFLNQGIAANPESCLLAFKLADRIELGTTNDDGADPGAKTRMQKVREPYDKVLDALYDLIAKTRAREERDVHKIEATLIELRADSATDPKSPEDLNLSSVDIEARTAAAQAQILSIKQRSLTNIELLRKTLSYAWIALMRAARRIQGKGLPTERSGGFRAIFGEARKRGKLTSEFYVECALIEYHCYKDPTGVKIFERGLKLFPEDEYYALEYLKHLISTNDVTNARAVFETTVNKLTAKPATAAKAKPLFSFFHDYESHYGDLAQIARLEQRMIDLYPEDLGLRQFAKRFASSTFDPTVITPIVSSQQMQAKQHMLRSIETAGYVSNSPATRIIESLNTNSPKRGFPEDFEDTQPRKMARGESPLKGAAGRRMNQQRQVNGLPSSAMSQMHVPPPPLPTALNYLLSIIPNASAYLDTRFDAVKMMELIRDIRLPPPGAVRPDQPPQPAHGWQQQPQQHFQHQPPASLAPSGYMPPPGMNQQFGGPFRYG